MNIEKLDTLLRDKLQGIESGVHENELAAVFAGAGVRKKNRKAFYLWMFAAVLGISCLGAYLLKMPQTLANMPAASPQETTTPAEVALLPEAGVKRKQEGLIQAGKAPVVKHKKEGSGFKRKTVQAITALNEQLAKEVVPTSGFEDDTENSKLNMAGITRRKQLYDLSAEGQVKVPELGRIIKKQSLLNGFLASAKPELSGWISPMASYETFSISNAADNKVHMDYEANRKGKEKPMLTLNTGLKLQFNVLPFLQFGTGVGYFQSGNSYSYQYDINRIPVIDSATQKIIAYLTRPGKHVEVSGRHVLCYAEIPLSLKLNVFTSPRIAIGIESAYALQILLSTKGQYIDPVSLELNNNRAGYKTRVGNFQIGIPIQYKLNKLTSLHIMPYYGHALQPVTSNPYETIQRTYTGLRLSINYKLYNPLK
jgi:hypothetical protein